MSLKGATQFEQMCTRAWRLWLQHRTPAEMVAFDQWLETHEQPALPWLRWIGSDGLLRGPPMWVHNNCLVTIGDHFGRIKKTSQDAKHFRTLGMRSRRKYLLKIKIGVVWYVSQWIPYGDTPVWPAGPWEDHPFFKESK